MGAGLGLALAAGAAEPAKSVGGWSPESLDTSVNPCDDFFQYACGGWNKANPIPGDQASWGTFNVLADRNRDTLRSILEAASPERPEARRDAAPDRRLLRDLHGRAGASRRRARRPSGRSSTGSAAVKTKADLPALVAQLHASGIGVLFGFGSEQDFKDATRVLAITGQGGLGLPDRDYYFRDDAKSKELREKYVAHVAKMFGLLGDAPDGREGERRHRDGDRDGAGQERRSTSVSQRDPQKIYHLMSGKEFAAPRPALLDAGLPHRPSGLPPSSEINVTEPEFVKALETRRGLDRASRALKTYLRWHAVHEAAPFLSSAFVNENFEFFGKTLTGAKELRPRWKRCVDATDDALGEALGRALRREDLRSRRQEADEGDGREPGGGARARTSSRFPG